MVDMNRFQNSKADPVEVSNKRPLPVGFGDSANLDAFARVRMAEPVGIFENKNIQSRRRAQWSEPIDGVILAHGGVTAGPFVVGDIVTGATSGATGIITIVNVGDVNVDTMDLFNDFETGEIITGATSGASATLSTVDTGSKIDHLPDQASVELTVGKISGDKVIRQTKRYHAYLPGKSHLITMTAVFGDAVNNVRRRIGYFDDMNGIYFEQISTGLAVVLRSSTTGVVVPTRAEQEDWNIDKLDGNGISGINLDITKSQILIIDMQWLGVGRIRIGFSIDGMNVYFHEFLNANSLDIAYMSTPTLPVRYEIEALAALNATASMKEICCAVASEGGYQPPGFEYSVSKEWVEREITVRTPILAIRLKNAFSATVLDNRRTIKYIDAGFFTRANDALFEVVHFHNPSDIVATWADVDGGSGAEYSNDITAVVGNPAHKIDHRYLPSGQGSSGGQGDVESFAINAHAFLSQNYNSDNSEMFVIYATPRTGTANVTGHLTWIEFE